MATQRLLLAGYGVAVPATEEPFDLLVYRRRRVWRVQVKATSDLGENGGRVHIRCGGDKRLRYCARRVDAVIAVHVIRNTVLCVPVRWLHGKSSLYFSTFADFSDFRYLRKARPPRP
jgi:hypothetical protein